jgi:prepilin-type N-terminal cleavage/methylation domain-containing protein/prepilin-type processing-associated H-X9-DG protein
LDSVIRRPRLAAWIVPTLLAAAYIAAALRLRIDLARLRTLDHSPPCWRTRAGLTLIELLVVIGVIALLIALLLPAVVAAREAARRAQCLSNLRQIGIALTHYETAVGRFPPGGWEWRPPRNTRQRQIAWSALILPYLEQGPLYAALNLNTAFDSPQNSTAAATIITTYLCPSARATGERRIDGRAACDYGGLNGQRITRPNNPPNGCMLYDVALRASEIRDGLSQTIIVGEDAGFPDGQWINGLNLFDQAFPINRAPAFENDLRSDHPGGAHVALADGSARFLKETLALPTLAALCTRSGGEIIDSNAW